LFVRAVRTASDPYNGEANCYPADYPYHDYPLIHNEPLVYEKKAKASSGEQPQAEGKAASEPSTGGSIVPLFSDDDNGICFISTGSLK
jgi:hypothetical protein